MAIYPNDITVSNVFAYPDFMLKLMAANKALWVVTA